MNRRHFTKCNRPDGLAPDDLCTSSVTHVLNASVVRLAKSAQGHERRLWGLRWYRAIPVLGPLMTLHQQQEDMQFSTIFFVHHAILMDESVCTSLNSNSYLYFQKRPSSPALSIPNTLQSSAFTVTGRLNAVAKR